MLALSLLLASLLIPVHMEPGTAVAELAVSAHASRHPSGLVGGDVLAGKSRPGKDFTKKQRQIVKERNAQAHGGKNRCENCNVETVPGQRHERGVTPPKNETQVDHKIPKAKGGPGEVENAQVLCRDCNRKKGSQDPEQEEPL